MPRPSPGAGPRVGLGRDRLAAVEQLDREGRIDLVFTDLVLSGSMNGHDVASHVARVR